MKDGKAEDKYATVFIVKIDSENKNKEYEVGKADINLANYVGEEWINDKIDIPINKKFKKEF